MIIREISKDQRIQTPIVSDTKNTVVWSVLLATKFFVLGKVPDTL